MKIVKAVALSAISLFSTQGFCDTLVLSQKLKVDYESPSLISHTDDSLIVKYDDWYFVHSVVNPKTVYHTVDLTGNERKYIKSIFDMDTRKEFPKWMAELSSEQAQEFGIKGVDDVLKYNVGKTDVLSTYDQEKSAGYIYVFDELVLHHIVVFGTKRNFEAVISSIKER